LKSSGVFLYPPVIGYDESEAAIYMAHRYADLTISRLTEAGVPIEVVKA